MPLAFVVLSSPESKSVAFAASSGLAYCTAAVHAHCCERNRCIPCGRCACRRSDHLRGARWRHVGAYLSPLRRLHSRVGERQRHHKSQPYLRRSEADHPRCYQWRHSACPQPGSRLGQHLHRSTRRHPQPDSGSLSHYCCGVAGCERLDESRTGSGLASGCASAAGAAQRLRLWQGLRGSVGST